MDVIALNYLRSQLLLSLKHRILLELNIYWVSTKQFLTVTFFWVSSLTSWSSVEASHWTSNLCS